MALILTSCGGGGGGGSSISPGKVLTAFSINGVTANISEAYKTVSVTLNYGSSVANLTVNFSASGGATVAIGSAKQVSGSINDFSQYYVSPSTYEVPLTVTSSDGLVATYTIKIVIGSISAKAINSFSLMAGANLYTGRIIEASKTINVTLPHNTSPSLLSSMVAKFTNTGLGLKIGGVDQVSEVTANDFSRNVTYTVTAIDGSSMSYMVSVAIAAIDNAIVDFTLNGVSGVVDEVHNSISIMMPNGSLLSSLSTLVDCTGQTFTINGVVSSCGNAAAISHDYSASPVQMVVNSLNGGAATYNIYVSNDPASAKEITEFVLDGVYGTIDDATENIAVTLPCTIPFVQPTMAAYFSTTGSAVMINGVSALLGQPSNPTYATLTSCGTSTSFPLVVTAVNSSTANYTVTVRIASSTESTITAFALDGVGGVINGANISVQMPTAFPLTNLLATYLTTGASVTVGANIQTSGINSNDYTLPLSYTVTAADGATQTTYTVTVTNVPSTTHKIANFSLNGWPGFINETSFPNPTIRVALPYGSTAASLTSPLVAFFSYLGTSVSAATTPQLSGYTANNFSGALTNDFSGTPTFVNAFYYTVSNPGVNNFSVYDVRLDISTCPQSSQPSYIDLGNYRLYNNPWNTTPGTPFTECMSGSVLANPQTGISSNWNWDFPPSPSGVKAYPSIQYRPSGVAPNIPLLPAATTTLTTTVNHNLTVVDTTTAPTTGKYNVAYDIWIDSTITQPTNCYKAELMIKLAGAWEDAPLFVGTPAPFTVTDPVTNNIYTFNVSVGTMKIGNCAWYYYSFMGYTVNSLPAISNPNLVGGVAVALPLQPFIAFLTSQANATAIATATAVTLGGGVATPIDGTPVTTADFITGIELGTEIIQGAGNITINSFSVTP
jgi:hypothetical protein